MDASSLNVVCTLAHGALGIGPVSSMVLAGRRVIVADERGKVMFLNLEKDSDQDAEAGPASISEGEDSNIAAISHDGKFLALILDTRCVLKSVANGTEIGEVSLENMHPVTGGMFLHDELETEERFLVWSNNGAATLYSITILDEMFRFAPLCEIPAAEYPLDERSTMRFCQFKSSLVRSASSCFELGDSLLWKPHVTIWSIPQGSSHDCISSSLLQGEGCFPSFPVEMNERRIRCTQCGECTQNGARLDNRIVSSSMVLSEDLYAPYAVIYGFYNGDIEVVQFTNIFQEVSSSVTNPENHSNSCTLERFFTGHTGAVICLAARRGAINSSDQRVCRVIVSGSMDCTVRIWDLDSGNVLSVMHHHVAPIKQIILPPPWTDHPWNNCFLTVAEDSCVALVSLETLRVERMFPGHPICPAMVAWDSTRGYIACLCPSTPSSSSSHSDTVLYLWDVKSGARERIIRGTASHSMFDHFCRGINVNSITGNILGGCTSASSLLLPFIDDVDSSQSHVRRNEKGKTAIPSMGVSHIRSANTVGIGKGKGVDQKSHTTENDSTKHVTLQKVHRNTIHPIKPSCPFPGIATLEFDLFSLMTIHAGESSDKHIENGSRDPTLIQGTRSDNSDLGQTEDHPIKDSLEECLLRFSLCFLHLWDVDKELDKLLIEQMYVYKPDGFYITSGVPGDRGAQTLGFPGLDATLQVIFY